MLRIENNENFETCKRCGGQCCKNCAGIYHPDEILKLPDHIIKQMFESKLLAVDTWDGDPRDEYEEDKELYRVYYFRPRHKNEDHIVSESWGGECVHLTETGCSLAFKDRPYQCRALIPGEERCTWEPECEKRFVSVLYIPHQDKIEELIKPYKQAIEA